MTHPRTAGHYPTGSLLDENPGSTLSGNQHDDVIAYGPRLHNSDRLNDYLWFFGNGSSGGSGFSGDHYSRFSRGGDGQQAVDSDSDGDGTPDDIDYDPNDPNIGGTVTVNGEAMTDAQKVAYDTAFNRAWWDVTLIEILGFSALTLLGRTGGIIGTALGVLEGRTTFSDQIVKDLAEKYYDIDGLDGQYDGFNELDRQGYYAPQRFPGY